jgi:hypothetical protein
MTLEMGDTAKDAITGFAGVVTGRSEYINGCVHLMIEAPAKPGMKPVCGWFDEQRCMRTKKGTALRRALLSYRAPPKKAAPHRRAESGGPAIHAPPSR